MARLKMSAPWVLFYREINAMFKDDPEVRVIYDEDEEEVRLYVENPTKAEALGQLLPEEKTFGNVTLKITIIPANGTAKKGYSLFQAAFDGNPAFSYVKVIRGIFANDITYVVFRNKVVQYFSDDLGDVNGNCSTLYQEIAKDIFEEQVGVFYCTDVIEPVYNTGLVSLGEPLGEWP